MLSRQFSVLIVLSGLFVPTIALADDAKPATQASQPLVDLSTPKSAAKSFAAACRSGDIATARACSVSDEKTVALVDCMATSLGALQRFIAVAEPKFPDMVHLMQGAGGGLDIFPQLEMFDETIAEDSATLKRNDGDSQALRMVKVEGKWKLDIKSIPNLDDVLKMVPQMNAMAKTFDTIVADIKSGKITNEEELQKAFAERAPNISPD